MIDVIAAGHMCLDIFPETTMLPLEALATPGRLFETGPLTISTGGSVSNTGLALHQLGVHVRLMSSVGDDFIGQAVIDVVERYGAGLSEFVTRHADQPSSYTIVLAPQKVDRIFLHFTGTNATLGADDFDYAVLERARMFHLGYPALLPRLIDNGGNELETIFRRASAAGAVTSMDMALPDPNAFSGQVDWRAIFQRVLPYVDIFIPSIEEILFCLRRAEYDAWRGALREHLNGDLLRALADELLAMGSPIVGFKLGELGMYLRTAAALPDGRFQRLTIDRPAWSGVELWQPAFQVEVAGTTGAGDSAFAGFLAGLLHALDPEEALRMACAVGACNVEAPDATSGIRSWQATRERIAAGWPLRPERIPGLLTGKQRKDT